MKKHIILYGILVLILAGCKESKPQGEQKKEPDLSEKLHTEIREMEEKEPARFLSIDSTNIGQNKVKEPGIFTSAKYKGWTIKGALTNSASMTAYNHVTLTVHFLDANNKELEKKDQAIDGYYNPGDSKVFEFKIESPKEATNYRVSVKGANALKAEK